MRNMVIKHVYIDESGDLGKQGSEYFIIAAIVTDDPLKLERIVKNVRQRKLKKKIREMPELKANKSNRVIRESILKKVRKTDCQIFAIIVEKKKIYDRLFNTKDRLYNYICKNLLDKIDAVGIQKLTIVVDKKHTNTLIRKNFDHYIKTSLCRNCSVEIQHRDSQASKALQVVDFVAWSIHRKFNHNDNSYWTIIEEKIMNRDKLLLWNK